MITMLLLIAQLQHLECQELVASTYLTPHWFVDEAGIEQPADKTAIEWPVFHKTY